MSLTTRVGLLAGASALTLTGASFADNPTEAQNWEARVAELEAQVAQLQGDDWLTEQRSDEIRSLVQDVLADADTRASLLQSGMTAGYDKGFVIGSADGNFLLKINGYTQIRWVLNYLPEDSLGALDQDDYDQLMDAQAPDNWGTDALAYAGTEAVWGGYAQDYSYPIVGGDTFYQAVIASGAFTAAQQNSLDSMLEDAATSVGDSWVAGTALAVKLDDVLDWDGDESLASRSYLDTVFMAMTEAQRDAIIAGLGIVNEAGTAVTTWSNYQALVARHAQAWYVANTANRDGYRSGFEARRTRLKFSGHIIDPTWTYCIYGDFGTAGNFGLLDAWIAKDLGNGWSAKFGQTSLPFLREWQVGAHKQLAVERSLLNAFYTQNRSQGIWLDYLGDQIHFTAALTDGQANLNTAWNNEDTEFAIGGRFEWMWAGNWGQFADFTSPRGSEYAGLLGVAVHYQNDEYGTGVPDLHPWDGVYNAQANADEVEQFDLTVDASMEFDGANLYGAFVYQSWDSDYAGDFDRYGFLIQGGYYFTDDLEGFVRYEWSDFDMPDLYWPVTGETAYSFDDLSVLTFGFNKYFAGHNIKWSTDLGIAFDRVEFFAANTGTGWRSDTGGDDGQIVFRTQLQLAF